MANKLPEFPLHPDMTLRDHFAAQIFVRGVDRIMSAADPGRAADVLASQSYVAADAMLAARAGGSHGQG